MRTWIVIVFALVVGIAAGLGTAMWRMYESSENGFFPKVEPESIQTNGVDVDTDGPQPKAVVREFSYDFGTIDSHGTGRHDFIFENNGDAVLKLKKGATTCKCAVADLAKTEILPGELGKVTVEWKVKGFKADFTQSATILTNDPRHSSVTLTIHGDVREPVQFFPSELVFSKLSNHKPTTGQIRVYGYSDKQLEIIGHEWLSSRTAKFFGVKFREMSHAEIGEEQGATSGYFVLVSVQPGLPLGLFKQTLRLRTNIESVEPISVPIRGTVEGDIAIVGRGWDRENGLLDFGTVDSRKASRRTLMLVVHGVHRREVKFRAVGIDPELLKVTFGRTIPINDGIVLQTPVTIEIPKGSRPISRLGSKQGELGQIIIDTNHPEMPVLTIPVRFAVTG